VTCLGALTAQATTLTLRQTTSDAELLTVSECVFETLLANFATSAYLFGFTGGGATLGEKEVGVHSQAVGLVLPCAVVAFRRFDSLVH